MMRDKLLRAGIGLLCLGYFGLLAFQWHEIEMTVLFAVQILAFLGLTFYSLLGRPAHH